MFTVTKRLIGLLIAALGLCFMLFYFTIFTSVPFYFAKNLFLRLKADIGVMEGRLAYGGEIKNFFFQDEFFSQNVIKIEAWKARYTLRPKSVDIQSFHVRHFLYDGSKLPETLNHNNFVLGLMDLGTYLWQRIVPQKGSYKKDRFSMKVKNVVLRNLQFVDHDGRTLKIHKLLIEGLSWDENYLKIKKLHLDSDVVTLNVAELDTNYKKFLWFSRFDLEVKAAPLDFLRYDFKLTGTSQLTDHPLETDYSFKVEKWGEYEFLAGVKEGGERFFRKELLMGFFERPEFIVPYF